MTNNDLINGIDVRAIIHDTIETTEDFGDLLRNMSARLPGWLLTIYNIYESDPDNMITNALHDAKNYGILDYEVVMDDDYCVVAIKTEKDF